MAETPFVVLPLGLMEVLVTEQGSGAGQHLPGLRLDELLDELQARTSARPDIRDRLHSLPEAMLSVSRELDVPGVLERIVETAMTLVNAEYGALGVLPPSVTKKQVIEMGTPPHGRGIPGELLRRPQPLRLGGTPEHQAARGSVETPPSVPSLLGVPIRVRGEAYGNLYLSEKRGDEDFDNEDKALLSTLAVAAGLAIDNALLHQQARRRQRWLEASVEVTNCLLSGHPQDQVLRLIVDDAKGIISADLVVLALPVPGADGLEVALAMGMDAERHRGLFLPVAGSLTGNAYSSGRPVPTADVAHDPRTAAGPARWTGFGPAVAVPMMTRGGCRGVMVLARDANEVAFADDDIAAVLWFAGQAALAMELADRRTDSEQIVLLEDRDRIARDLHDLAIQRLFAAGITLQGAQRLVHHPEASQRLARAVDEMDATIKIIRSTIFGLRPQTDAEQGLRIRITRVVNEFEPSLGFVPSLRMQGLVDTEVPPAVADEVLAAVGEALTNIARHAKATTADVLLIVEDGMVSLTVSDDGVGMAQGGRRSGLHNLAVRAEQFGGELVVDSPPEGGTRLVWRVPV